MQQRQLRLGDILDDYCPRERRVTNHAVVAMIGDDVKQTRCTTCDAEHEYKHAKVPRQRRKAETPAALYAQVLAGAPKRVVHEPAGADAAGAEPRRRRRRADVRREPTVAAATRRPPRAASRRPTPERRRRRTPTTRTTRRRARRRRGPGAPAADSRVAAAARRAAAADAAGSRVHDSPAGAAGRTASVRAISAAAASRSRATDRAANGSGGHARRRPRQAAAGRRRRRRARAAARSGPQALEVGSRPPAHRHELRAANVSRRHAMSDLSGKHGLIVGVANKRSISWAIAQAAAAAGARLALTYPSERLEENVRELAATLDNPLVAAVRRRRATSRSPTLAAAIDREFGGLDFLVHGAAFAPQAELTNPFVETSREGFRIALDVSAYSLIGADARRRAADGAARRRQRPHADLSRQPARLHRTTT